MSITFCWTDISGYMAACWREMAKTKGISLFVLAFGSSTETEFDTQLMEGIPHRLLDKSEREDGATIAKIVADTKPDYVVLAGWFHTPYRQLLNQLDSDYIKFILAMDTPYWGKWKQKLAPIVLRGFLKKINKVVVSGERSWQYARRLGFAHQDILKGQYAIDYPFFSSMKAGRDKNNWPRNFLFVGRYSEVKAVDILVAAYQQYRQHFPDTAWTLTCCGKGPLEYLLADQSGIINRGFVQPAALPEIFINSGVFIMPSRFDPWPLSIIEACAAGLPVICTSVCGTSVELVKSWHNGWTIAEDNITALTHSMILAHQHHEALAIMGQRSGTQAAAYTPPLWVLRWQHFLADKQTIPIRSGLSTSTP